MGYPKIWIGYFERDLFLIPVFYQYFQHLITFVLLLDLVVVIYFRLWNR
jgi:hypothetical protein